MQCINCLIHQSIFWNTQWHKFISGVNQLILERRVGKGSSKFSIFFHTPIYCWLISQLIKLEREREFRLAANCSDHCLITAIVIMYLDHRGGFSLGTGDNVSSLCQGKSFSSVQTVCVSMLSFKTAYPVMKCISRFGGMVEMKSWFHKHLCKWKYRTWPVPM